MFCDVNNDGIVTESEIIQEDHYYPFGMKHEGYGRNVTQGENFYQYNGKELNEDFGLDWYSFEARFYDAVIGRFPSVDPIIEVFPSHTPYNFAFSNPSSMIDLYGLQGEYPQNMIGAWSMLYDGCASLLRVPASYIDNLGAEKYTKTTIERNVTVGTTKGSSVTVKKVEEAQTSLIFKPNVLAALDKSNYQNGTFREEFVTVENKTTVKSKVTVEAKSKIKGVDVSGSVSTVTNEKGETKVEYKGEAAVKTENKKGTGAKASVYIKSDGTTEAGFDVSAWSTIKKTEKGTVKTTVGVKAYYKKKED
jgi:RHS repeat-associated protein